MRRRSLHHVALAAVVLAMALPAAAAGSASARSNLNLTLGPACAGGGSVTYSWSGFGGAKTVMVDVYDSETATYPVHRTVDTHGASGSVTFTFDETSGQNYTASGSLLTKKGSATGSAQVQYGTAGCS
jgi:hypothetical protein